MAAVNLGLVPKNNCENLNNFYVRNFIIRQICATFKDPEFSRMNLVAGLRNFPATS